MYKRSSSLSKQKHIKTGLRIGGVGDGVRTRCARGAEVSSFRESLLPPAASRFPTAFALCTTSTTVEFKLRVKTLCTDVAADNTEAFGSVLLCPDVFTDDCLNVYKNRMHQSTRITMQMRAQWTRTLKAFKSIGRHLSTVARLPYATKTSHKTPAAHNQGGKTFLRESFLQQATRRGFH